MAHVHTPVELFPFLCVGHTSGEVLPIMEYVVLSARESVDMINGVYPIHEWAVEMLLDFKQGSAEAQREREGNTHANSE